MTEPTSAAPTRGAGSRAGTAAVVLAAGAGSRAGARRGGVAVNKVLVPVGPGGVPVLARSVATALAVAEQVVVVVRPGERDDVATALAPHLRPEDAVGLVEGGASRHASEWAALRALAGGIDAGRTTRVAIHDGARPLATEDLWRAVLAAADVHGGAVPGVLVRGLLGRDLQPVAVAVAAMQTPQAFQAGPLLAAYRAAAEEGFEGTDTASCFTRFAGLPVRVVRSGPLNPKVTFGEDLGTVDRLLRG